MQSPSHSCGASSRWQEPVSERIIDFTIVSKIPVAFVRVKYAEQIFASLAELASDFQEEIRKSPDYCPGCSHHGRTLDPVRHGTWRFFLVTDTGLTEIDRQGWPLMQAVKKL